MVFAGPRVGDEAELGEGAEPVDANPVTDNQSVAEFEEVDGDEKKSA